MSHPNPLTSKIRDPETENVVGWFDLAFKKDVDHWYTFTVYNNGMITPNIYSSEDIYMDPKSLLTFVNFLSDQDLVMVKFTRNNNYNKYANITTSQLKHLITAFNPTIIMGD